MHNETIYLKTDLPITEHMKITPYNIFILNE